MNIISSFSSVRMSALCALSALLMISCQDNIEPENGKDDPGKPDDTEEPVDPPVESTDPALTAFTPLSGSNGAEVTLTGKNFGTDATAVKVYFIDTDLQTEKEATVVSVSDEEIKVTVPAGPGEECKIKVVIGETELVYDTLFDYVYQTVVSTLFGGAQTAAENPTGTFSFADAAFFGTFDNEHHTLVMGNDGCIYFALENSEKGFLNARRHNVYKTDLNAQTITCIGTVESWVSILPIAMDPKTNAIYGMRGDASEGKMAYYNGSEWDSEVVFTWDKKDNLGSGNRTLLSAGMEAKDNGVAGLDGAERFKDCGGSGVGHRGYAADYADGFGNLQITFQFIVVDNANRFHVFDAVPNIFGGEHILDDFVLINATLGFFHRHFGKLHVVVQTGQNHLVTNVVDLFLGVAHELMQSFLGFRHVLVDDLRNVDLLLGLNGSFFFRHITVPP